MIPEDESVLLKGATFADFEDQAEVLAQMALAGMLELPAEYVSVN